MRVEIDFENTLCEIRMRHGRWQFSEARVRETVAAYERIDFMEAQVQGYLAHQTPSLRRILP